MDEHGDIRLADGYIPNANITIITAYSRDYTIGRICEAVNRSYAQLHGYGFLADAFDCDEVIQQIAPKMHFTWYKVLLLLKIMRDQLEDAHQADRPSTRPRPRPRYLFWIDADAIVIKSHITVQSLIQQGGCKELLIAEDMHSGCLLNAGVFLLQVCPWALGLLQDMWDCHRYDTVPFYEQSALIAVLKRYREGLHAVSPFHSYTGGPQGVKHFPHTAVFPHSTLNSNIGINLEGDGSDAAELFIYHAAGLKSKLAHIRAAINCFQVHLDASAVDMDAMEFKMVRTAKGHYRKEVVDMVTRREEEARTKALGIRLDDGLQQGLLRYV